MKKIGTINLTTGKVIITDPCYNKGTWCTATVENVHKGEWEVYVDEVNAGMWGNRIGQLEIRAVGQEVTDQEELDADIGVDAGLCGIFEDKPDYGDGRWSTLCDDHFFNNSYGIATKENGFGCVGCWSSSGYGDGSYVATVAYNEEGEVVGINIDYGVSADDDDEYEDEYEDEDESESGVEF